MIRFDNKRLAIAAITVALVFCFAFYAWAQTGADPWAQVKKDAQTSESNQRSAAVQARLQQWFIAKVKAYQAILDNTALGKANPKVIDLGDFTQHYKRILAPPTGTGTAVILFSDEVSTASTMEDTMDILFPKSGADAYIDMHFETCWHEFQHPITMVSQANGRQVAAQLEDWSIWRKPPADEYAEHIYIESLGEYTIEWLDYLLPEKSTLRGGNGLGFEKHCQDAYEQIKQYQARGESISYAIENFCWAKAHEAWIKA